MYQSVHGILQTDIETIRPVILPEAQQANVPIETDEGTMNILTDEMENLIIESKLSQQDGEVARERAEVVQCFQAELKLPWRRRTSSSLRHKVDVPLSSSPLHGSSLDAEVIDVDAEPDSLESNKDNWRRTKGAWAPVRNVSKQKGEFVGVQSVGNSRARSESY